MATPTPDKKSFRTQLLAHRRNRNTHTKKRLDEQIITHLRDHLRLHNAQRIAAYVADETEPGGINLVPELAAIVDTLWLPVSKNDGVLHWGHYKNTESLTIGRYGIPEPVPPHSDSSILHTLDMIIVPGLAAHPNGQHMGKGAGYYDRALAGVSTATTLLIYHDEIRADVPTEAHDVTMTFFLDEYGTIRV
ncbi:5,10-methenyltetrahydrofolate synthetase [Corynebacterium kutscheri]|uniref:5-formyltetrahydrofolate cyclo-ligase n=1 Tax=Corynebacterium kutscheri TaxID=35755 RepID=A0A0F6TDT9_9CORY|nr:5-formyltetrahydrofolate cyclo-ligase [Corynebacterium kutscheri]AKE41831.1 5,10-methenyltetrahydrofolate synthetase [Corynebacterium kutscheri]VEH10159.1 5-formyltetrahydrofolate cyclo-ligase [Corynebacterium kutscheri]